MTLERPAVLPLAPPVLGDRPDPALLKFLRERLLEEVPDATARRDRSLGTQRAHRTRGLRLLIRTVEQLRTPDPDLSTVRLLMLAYRRHPRFRPEWDADPAALGRRGAAREGA